jgi:mono/diheme cytochrome c family protein
LTQEPGRRRSPRARRLARLPGTAGLPMSAVAAGLAAGLGVPASVELASPPVVHAQIVPAPTQNALAGSRVFGDKGCVECHAVNGLGGQVGPDLARTPEAQTFYDLAADMWNHLPQMAAVMDRAGVPPPRLDTDEVADLIAFLFTLDYFGAPGDPDAGRQLFVDKRCVICHQIGGMGGVIGPNLDNLSHSAPIQVAAAMWNHGMAMTAELRKRGIARPSFSGGELRDLIAFFQSNQLGPPEGGLHVLPGRPAVGAQLFVDKGCVDCHAVSGRGGTVGPDLSRRASHSSLLDFAAAMWNKQPAMTAAMRARGIEPPEVSAAEMADLVAYLYSTNYLSETGSAARGRVLVMRKGCTGCHALNGRGGQTGPDFAELDASRSNAEVISDLWNHLPIIAEQPQAEWPPMNSAEMADLAAFLRAGARN